jgi:hypothetical protein
VRLRGARVVDLRAALWAADALRAVRRGLAAGEARRVAIRRAPGLPADAVRGVEAVLRRRRSTCLEAALVRQRWLEAQGVPCDVVIGVTSPSSGFRAHAWLEEPGRPVAMAGHVEIARLEP